MTSALTQVDRPDDRRFHRRYPLQTSVRYRPANSRLNAAWKQGRALNMSAGGILVQLTGPLAIGSKLELAMDWPGLYHGREKMRLFLLAQVTRTTDASTALRIVSHRFRDMSPGRVRLRRAESNLAVA